jgi:hypothetical protein
MLFAKQPVSLFAVTLIGLALSPTVFAETVSPERLKEVTERGRHVMPFDLKQTQHIFNKTETGGLQQVFVRNPPNPEQVALIRQHLSKISQEFSHGDFSNPARIHGENMPGLAELRKAAPGQLHVDYKELKDGAEITYSSEEPALVDAIHRWFDAQLADHGPDAMSGHPHGDMHNMHNMHEMHDMKNMHKQ